ncbi:hypothetical protein TNCV_2929091 [Trichonephila clavipes]|nr:hypothetical protein TNCV_2929091 [Trichonephila clavipes]
MRVDVLFEVKILEVSTELQESPLGDNRRDLSNGEHCRLGRWRENRFRNQRRCDGQLTRCWTRNLTPLHSRRSRMWDCAFPTNRTLMRPRAMGRLWGPANDKGRGEGRVVDPPLVFKRVFLGEREEPEQRQRRQRPEEIRAQMEETREQSDEKRRSGRR